VGNRHAACDRQRTRPKARTKSRKPAGCASAGGNDGHSTGIASKRFVVLGRVGMDLTAEPIGVATPEATGMMVSMGGSSANIAAGLVKLGCAAALVTCVSDDAVGRYCLNQLDAYGIDRSHVRKHQGRGTHLARGGRRPDRGPQHGDLPQQRGRFPDVEADVNALDYASFGALVTTGTVFAAEPSRSAACGRWNSRAAGLTVIFDVDYRPYSWPSAEVASEVLTRAAGLSDVIVGNDEEFDFMAGGIGRGLDKARDPCAATTDIVVYKRGPDGAITFAGGEEIATGIFRSTALKPTGAGDSFMAGLLAALAEGRT
jgi:5-dehydro-2-deoxygluconokinase